MTPLAAYLLLFVAVGVGFILVHLLAGKLIRPNRPDSEKGTIYECGEPTIGSAWIQFDLRFYVVALLFVIFDVEVAFFFPWAEVFGKANAIAATEEPTNAAEYRAYAEKVLDLTPPHNVPDGYEKMRHLTAAELEEIRAEKERVEAKHQQKQELTNAEDKTLRMTDGQLKSEGQGSFEDTRKAARALAMSAFWEVLVFFGVLLVGFAYLWRRGDLAWVRSTLAEQTEPAVEVPPPVVVVPPAREKTEIVAR